MNSIFKVIIFIALAVSVCAQETDSLAVNSQMADSVQVNDTAVQAVLTDEEKLCKEVAEDIMDIYDNWNPERDYNILYPRVKGFVDDFFNEYPDFNYDIIEKDKLGENLNDYERRSLVAYKGLKDDKIFAEIARFITTKDFYWGYINEDLNNGIAKAANKIKEYTVSRKNILLADQKEYVESLLQDSRKYDRQLDSIKAIPDEKVVDDLLEDETYNNEMMAIEFKIDSLKSKAEAKALLEQLIRDKDIKIMNYIRNKKAELIVNKRNDKIAAKDLWIEEKRQTIFDLYELEKARLSDIVYSFTSPLVEERKIVSFDVTADLIKLIHESKPKTNEISEQQLLTNKRAEEQLKQQIKYKFYNQLVGVFGSAVIYNEVPVFRTFRTNVLIGTFLFMILFFYIFIKVKKNREKLFIRRIPGLDAIDDAVGRATEMGKPVVYDSGIGYYTQIDTIASMLILRSVSKKVAEFKAEIYVPTCDPIVMQISEEMVASGFLDAGYPEDHKKDNIFFLAADQFAFAAGIAGILSRKKPATAFHFGYYAAESLLISEAGFAAGAIQVAGTTAVAQLPFFITACDYTLIGEELYAAAAYISRDAQIMTNLKLSDFAKVVIGILFILGTIILTINSEWTFLQDLLITR